MTLGLMAKDCEIRIDYDKLRKDRLPKNQRTNEARWDRYLALF